MSRLWVEEIPSSLNRVRGNYYCFSKFRVTSESNRMVKLGRVVHVHDRIIERRLGLLTSGVLVLG